MTKRFVVIAATWLIGAVVALFTCRPQTEPDSPPKIERTETSEGTSYLDRGKVWRQNRSARVWFSQPCENPHEKREAEKLAPLPPVKEGWQRVSVSQTWTEDGRRYTWTVVDEEKADPDRR